MGYGCRSTLRHRPKYPNMVLELNRETVTAEHEATVKSTPTPTRLVYTNGSKQGERTGWAWVEQFPRRAEPARTETGPLQKAEVFDAEVVAIHMAVKQEVAFEGNYGLENQHFLILDPVFPDARPTLAQM